MRTHSYCCCRWLFITSCKSIVRTKFIYKQKENKNTEVWWFYRYTSITRYILFGTATTTNTRWWRSIIIRWWWRGLPLENKVNRREVLCIYILTGFTDESLSRVANRLSEPNLSIKKESKNTEVWWFYRHTSITRYILFGTATTTNTRWWRPVIISRWWRGSTLENKANRI